MKEQFYLFFLALYTFLATLKKMARAVEYSGFIMTQVVFYYNVEENELLNLQLVN